MTKATLIKTQGMNSKQAHDFDTKCDPVKNEATATGIEGWGNSRTDAGDPYVKIKGVATYLSVEVESQELSTDTDHSSPLKDYPVSGDNSRRLAFA